MQIGAISVNTENTAIDKTPPAVQPADGGQETFSETLRSRTALSSSADLDVIFDAAGQRYNIPPNLLKAVAKVESNFNPTVTSSAGAMGIMQLMPGTARGLGVTDAFDPEQNIMGGAKYLRQMLDRFDGDLSLALGAYNAGPGNVEKHGGVPSFSQNYVLKVLGLCDSDIVAGMVTYSLPGKSDNTDAFRGLSSYIEAMSQMLFIKLIEMQMNSSDDKKKNLF